MSKNDDKGIRQFVVAPDDDGIRLDRWFKRHLPDASFNIVSRWARTGQLRIDGKKATPGDRILAGQVLRVPPADAALPGATMAPFSRARVRMTPSLGAINWASACRRSICTILASSPASWARA